MKNTIKGLCICAIAVLGLSVQAAEAGKTYFKIDGGLSMVGDTDIKNASDAELKFDPGFRIDLAGGYMLSRDFALELEAGFIMNSIDEIKYEGETESLDADLYQIPVLANLIYTIPLDSKFKPFLGVGAGGIWSIADGDDVDSEDDFTFAIQGQAGVSYKISESMDFGVVYKFLANFEPELGDSELDDVYTHSILAVLTFNF